MKPELLERRGLVICTNQAPRFKKIILKCKAFEPQPGEKIFKDCLIEICGLVSLFVYLIPQRVTLEERVSVEEFPSPDGSVYMSVGHCLDCQMTKRAHPSANSTICWKAGLGYVRELMKHGPVYRPTFVFTSAPT